MRQVRYVAIAALAASTLSACATKGFVRKGLEDQRVALTGQIDTERSERTAADNTLRTDVGQLRTDLTALRNDLTSLRTDYDTRITAMEGAVKFAMPVHFGFDDASVREQDRAALERFAQVAAKHYKGATITIEGFADPAGSAAYNLRLSRERADAVRDYLVTKGLDGAVLRTVGYGKTRLVNPTAARDAAGAELNRRVTFVVETPTADATVTALQGGGN
jgi:peptidoglycan-associated lipoprotein